MTTTITVQNFSDDKVDVTENVISAGDYIVTGFFNCKPGTARLRITNSYAGSKNVTFTAGDFAPAVLGNKTVSMAQNEVYEFNLDKEQARFQKFNGDLYLTLEAGMTGVITATGDTGYM